MEHFSGWPHTRTHTRTPMQMLLPMRISTAFPYVYVIIPNRSFSLSLYLTLSSSIDCASIVHCPLSTVHCPLVLANNRSLWRLHWPNVWLFLFLFFLGYPNVRGLCPLLILISASAGTILSLDCGGEAAGNWDLDWFFMYSIVLLFLV